MKRPTHLAALALTAVSASGCLYVTGSLPPCSSVLREPTRLSVQISGASRETPWARSEVRDSLHVQIGDAGGISVWLYRPNLRHLECARVPEVLADQWVATSERLLTEPGVVDVLDPAELSGGEIVLVESRRRRVAVELDRLTPNGLEAVRNLSCLALEAFGYPIENALREASPALTLHLGFPETCAQGEMDQATREQTNG